MEYKRDRESPQPGICNFMEIGIMEDEGNLAKDGKLFSFYPSGGSMDWLAGWLKASGIFGNCKWP